MYGCFPDPRFRQYVVRFFFDHLSLDAIASVSSKSAPSQVQRFGAQVQLPKLDDDQLSKNNWPIGDQNDLT